MEETAKLLEDKFGPLPESGIDRRRFVRNKMIESIESDLGAAVFELSSPSLGTGVEFAHAYLRPRMGLRAIPILALYERDFWPNGLSTMIQGIEPETSPTLTIAEYGSAKEAQEITASFLNELS